MKTSIAIAVMALFLAGAVASVKEKPDVLFIAIDDMSNWTTLFDPANLIKTPNLERLAKRGAFFTRAYCSAPVPVRVPRGYTASSMSAEGPRFWVNRPDMVPMGSGYFENFMSRSPAGGS